MELRVASWNLDGWHTIRDEQRRLLDETRADLVLLQEVTPTSLDRLRDDGWHGTSALELVAEDHTERRGARPRFACAVLARGDVTIVTSELIPGAPSPVRTLMSHLRVRGTPMTAVSAALPPGSMWGRAAKVAQADALSEALRRAGPPAIIGMDRNGPRFERWDVGDTEWWPEDPASFFDEDAAHGCVDVLDRWYASNSDAHTAARRRRPDGPREVSYIERRADPAVERRYDVILASSGIEPRDVRYRYLDAIEAGSDHGIVEATLDLAVRS